MESQNAACAELLASGAFDYVTKPFDLEALARILAAALVYRG